jgi:hypothetical protein
VNYYEELYPISEWVRRKGAGAKVGIQVEFEIFKGPPSTITA